MGCFGRSHVAKKTVCIADVVIWFFFLLPMAGQAQRGKFRNRMGMNGPVQKKGVNAQREKQGSGGGKSNLKSNPFLLAGKLGWRGS